MMNYWKPYENIRREKNLLIVTRSMQLCRAQVHNTIHSKILRMVHGFKNLGFTLPTTSLLFILLIASE